MDVHIHESWRTVLKQEFQQPYFLSLLEYVEHEYASHTCYPEIENIFAAFNHSPFDTTKVVIIGQDPYHGPDQANGLCFSVKDGLKHPPSLINIFKELKADTGINIPKSGNLERWAKQGVLLINATLTVRAHEPASHQKKGWEQFTDAVIKKLSDDREGLVFILWGGFAKKKSKLINARKHHILTSGHPSPLSANRGYWFGNGHFSQANKALKLQKRSLIKW